MIGIIGLGWLGVPLAQRCKQANFQVKGSTTSQEKQSNLAGFLEHVHLLKFEDGKCRGDLAFFMRDVTTLVVTLPPKSQTNQYAYYLKHLALIRDEASRNNLKKLLFTSSTGVFEDQFPYPTYTEQSVLVSKELKSSVLQQAEQVFLDNLPEMAVAVVRLGGLVGEGREPARFLSGRPLKNPAAPVNLVHQYDAVELIFKLINLPDATGIFHAVYPLTCSREEYYIEKTNSLSLAPPIIEAVKNHVQVGKKVSSQLTQETLDFKFKKRP